MSEPGPGTHIRWTVGDFTLGFSTSSGTYTPEAIEQLLNRTRREFIAGARLAGTVSVEAEEAHDPGGKPC